MIVLPGADHTIAQQVARRALDALAKADLDAYAPGFKVTASIGIATYTPKHRFASTIALLEAADHALYAAKLRGRNRFECYEDFSPRARSPLMAR